MTRRHSNRADDLRQSSGSGSSSTSSSDHSASPDNIKEVKSSRLRTPEQASPSVQKIMVPVQRRFRKHRDDDDAVTVDVARHLDMERARQQAEAQAAAEEEARLSFDIEQAVRERTEAAMASPEVQARIQKRLKDERAALEEKVTRQLEAERRALLAKKRAQQEERRRKADDLERILLDNQRKVEEAQHRAAVEKERRGGAALPALAQQPAKWKENGIVVIEDGALK